MKKCVYFDIQFGASGDMLVGSLIALGLEPSALRSMLSGILPGGWSLDPHTITRYHMSGIQAGITASEGKTHRNLTDIRELLYASSLPENVRNNASAVFTKLAEAEAHVHGVTMDSIHFHEVGAADSIIDIAAFCSGIEMLGAEGVLFNEFNFGSGSVNCRHGELPVPVPAVVELSRGFRVRMTGRNGELVTPTAAAILTTLGTQLEPGTGFAMLASGIGFGTREYDFPSYTRAFLVDTETADECVQVECTIDDMNPQIYPHLMEALAAEGAYDTWITPVIMKKGRPGTQLSVLTDRRNLQRLRSHIFRETTTLGIREFAVSRERLERRFENVSVYGSSVRIKTAYLEGILINIQPEFEDCRSIAVKENIPVKEVSRRAVEEYGKKIREG
jgi:pyridinium-3,5-bisthiocarboxylic acid mononucleotide nickel chelatase